MDAEKLQILLTNDDGIDSPGLWAAAEALSSIGYVWVVAPREQSSGTGRSMPSTSDGIIRAQTLNVHGQDWTVYAVGGTPAQAVQHAIMEIMPQKPDLVVSGINYGSNLGPGITVSGTVGAAMEGASHGIPAIAISLETESRYHLSYSKEIDFCASAHFTTYFARLYLDSRLDPDIRLLKIEVPADATPQTPWAITRLSPIRYYQPLRPERTSWEEAGTVGYAMKTDPALFPEDSDVYAILSKRVVAVTPLSLDMTARVDLHTLEADLRSLDKRA
ncbi:MAG: 5'/3'-nucleotidase SurE [Anaerolineales bacterium]|nr:5'/3'-nucleotidase SurE [Anaerolineales bacterium]